MQNYALTKVNFECRSKEIITKIVEKRKVLKNLGDEDKPVHVKPTLHHWKSTPSPINPSHAFYSSTNG